VSTTENPLPLAGHRIIAIEQYGATPYGSLYLAQLGAEVIKIEPPRTGEISRSVGPHLLGAGDSEFFQTFNANKRSLTLNIKAPAGRRILEQLVGSADALIHNLRGDHPAKLKLTHADLATFNPRIVCGHLTAYGREGERASWPGYDYLMQAEAGFLSLTGEPGGMPTRFGLSMVDYMTGLVLALAVVAGMARARETGVGGDVDASLFDTAVHQLSYLATWYLNEGYVTRASPRSAHPSITPSQLVRTADGWLFLMCQTQKFWLALVALLGDPALAGEPRFATMAGRLEHRAALTVALDALFSQRSTSAWLQLLRGVVPVAPVQDVAEVLEGPFVKETEMITTVPHPLRPALKLLANPIRCDGRRLPARPAPALGADADDLLSSLGYTPDDIRQLRADAVV